MKFIITIFLLIICTNSKAQINTPNWLFGGSAKFSTQSQSINSANVKGLNIKFNPNIGYFVIDKLATGIKLGLTLDRVEYNGGVSKSTQLSYGPFVRYYFLPTENRINLLGEFNYQHLTNTNNSTTTKDQLNAFTISTGTAIFFNSSVAIEALVNYELLNNSTIGTNAKTFYLSIGFQIHLEKDKN